jgi:TPR repeat protein
MPRERQEMGGKDMSASFWWHRKAADLGGAKMSDLSLCLENCGWVVAEDLSAAVWWYGKAADLWYSPAVSN